MPRRMPLVLLVLPVLITLAACTGSVTRTLPAETVAGVAAGALEDQYGIEVESLDCGDEPVDFVAGTTLDCVVTVDGEPSDATVTIASVDGDDYNVDVDVPEASWLTAPESGSDPTSPAGDGAALSIYSYELADAAEGALEPQYGARPTITCPGDRIDISVGTTVDCDLVEAKTGARGIATITVTKIDGTEYAIDVQVVDA